MKTLLCVILLLLFVLFACQTPPSGEILIRQTDSPTNATTSNDTNHTEELYTLAIAKFIQASKNQKGITYQKLHFGKHAFGQPDDFPDISLPERIENVEIKLISPAEGEKIQAADKNNVYINMMGYIMEDRSEFIFVVFKNGFAHQHDYILKLNDKYEVSEERFEEVKTGRNSNAPAQKL